MKFLAIVAVVLSSTAIAAQDDERPEPSPARHDGSTSFSRALDKLSAMDSAEEAQLTVQIASEVTLDIAGELFNSTGDKVWSADYLRSENERSGIPFRDYWRERGASVQRYSALTNILTLRLPVGAALELISSPDVVDASMDGGDFTPQATYAGEFLRQEVRATGFLSAGFDGNVGNRINAAAPIYVVDIEVGQAHNHLGYLDTAGGSNRLSHRICSITTNTCVVGSPAPNSTPQTHADQVISTLAGSIEQGQDPLHTTTSARRDRSGIASEVDIGYTRLSGNFGPGAPDQDGNIANALELALNDSLDNGADIVNMSFTVGFVTDPVSHCNYSFNPGLANATIDVVSALGVLILASAGQDPLLRSFCYIGWPALRPPVIAVGGIDTSTPGGSFPPYDDQGVVPEMFRGGVPMTVDGFARTNAAIDLMAPSDRTRTYQENNGYNVSAVGGSSIATPIVAGLAALWIDQAEAIGVSRTVRRIQTALFLGANRPQTPTFTYTGTTDTFGFGRIKLYQVQDAAFGAGAPGVVLTNRTLTGAAPTVLIPVSATVLPGSVTQLDVVAFWDETGDLSNAADIILRVESTCAGFSTRSDLSYNLTKQISFDPSAGCPQIRLEGVHLPANRTVFVGFVVSSGSNPT